MGERVGMESTAKKRDQEQEAIEVGSLFQNMPFTKKHSFVGMALFMAFVIEAWEMMIIIMISGDIAAEFSLTPVQVGSLIGSIFLGMIPGTYVWGIVGDKIGRKKRSSTVYCFMESFL